MHLVFALLLFLTTVATAYPVQINATPTGFREPVTGMEFIMVPEGCFSMGNQYGDAYFNEMPVHEVCLTSFSIGRYAVTRGAFSSFVAATGYRTDAERNGGCFVYDGREWQKNPGASWRNPGFLQNDRHPAVCVSWNDAQHFSRWLSTKSGREIRLPQEAEWEYAARSGGKRERYAGSDDIDTVAWYADNSNNRTHPAGEKLANGLGLYDMSGNVWQWTSDWYNWNYYRISPRVNPTGPESGTQRVFRGGSWFYDARGVRNSYRDFAAPDFASSYLGFRLVAPQRRE
jgi:formylglycine-generating enzyme required for sulfatase activity